jgi:hypothetical protein
VKKSNLTDNESAKMKTAHGVIQGWRLGIVEPVFANIGHAHGLRRFSLRGKAKVNTQWLLYCLVHNIGKLQRYGANESETPRRLKRGIRRSKSRIDCAPRHSTPS